ncbi:hypothetical protein ACFYU9_05250 [Streptomyces sp. NPDC004327]|uniref:hypothetical protein n=1 Tax=Streptomyces sp. NPDC004327 TaxID=3364699 RepID=UPI003689D768
MTMWTCIASSECLSGWRRYLHQPRPCSAIVDHLTFNGAIIENGTDSHPLAGSPARRHPRPAEGQVESG